MKAMPSEPPMAWRYCGNQIKLWRIQANVSRQELADKSSYDYESIKSMEVGRRRPTLHLLEVADEVCGAQGKLKAAQEYLKPEKFRSYAQGYMEYEVEAIAHSSFQPMLIPGLLQTPEYIRALFQGHCPPMDDETQEVRLAARLERQNLLDHQTRAFGFVIGEAALREQIGGPEVHKGQLLHLIEAGKRRNITIQVMPFNVGLHPGMLGSFVLLETPDHQKLVYLEAQETGMLDSDPENVSSFTQRHDMILRKALDPEASAAFIRKLAEEL
ncbi:helix-turn-helix domain-containing protein [Streptomyces palmae]|uniref:XRE family transcriptional regulator n=1 Tax=Streptomyces palmae TaxID=1701085 RepID=A0A4Z0GMK2_9ACTN|nr:helix-turn-helix transcriptional regulator [Streptomyces palmae]TGA98061.1 XRE family transcriptional regulator [Streptomyces palmae]